jgi:hypothetical protein
VSQDWHKIVFIQIFATQIDITQILRYIYSLIDYIQIELLAKIFAFNKIELLTRPSFC